MAFPASKTTFVDPAGTNYVAGTPVNGNEVDHAGAHTAHNNLLEEIEDNLGTNSGTSVLKHFTAGQFPVRHTGVADKGTLLQTLVGGTLEKPSLIGTPQITGGSISTPALIGTPQITGGSAANMTVGTPTVVVGSDAQGDIYYRSSGGTLNRLGPGTSGQFLKTQGAAANPIWDTVIAISSKVITTVRDISEASGTVGYTGVGFQPTSIIALANVDGIGAMGIGFSDSAGAEAGMEQDYLGSASTSNSAKLIGLTTASGAGQSAVVTSYTSDGFILTWT